MKLNQELHRFRPEMQGRIYNVIHEWSEEYPGSIDFRRPWLGPMPMFRSHRQPLGQFDCFVDAHHHRKLMNRQLRMTAKLSNFNRVVIRCGGVM